MSTTDSASVGRGTHDSTIVNRLPLPSFTPVRDERDRSRSQTSSNSSISGSQSSAPNPTSRSQSALRTSSPVVDSDDGRQEQWTTNALPRRKQNRSSGGFLLEPTTHSSRLSRVLLSGSYDVKGKRKSETAEILLPKRRNKHKTVVERNSFQRGSPLSIELKPDQDGLTNDTNPDSTRQKPEMEAQQGFLIAKPPSQRSAAMSVGYDTDPAQIVDMALKLSAGRRRQASGRRLISGNTTVTRVSSNASPRQIRTPTKTRAPYITSPTPVSATPPPPPATVMQSSVGKDGHDSMLVNDPFSPFAPNEPPAMPEGEFDISRATISRVEKAKVYLELAYEHRRLLSHLPPIRRPGNRVTDDNIISSSKSYNPLQYARNRKLRIREKSAINAEADGWHDVEKVRAWVDAVINTHTKTSHDSLDCVRLPPLSLREAHEDGSRSPNLYTSPRSPRHQQPKPRRPKSDWVTHPGDLIADAFWLEQGLNKTKIQDRDNNTVYRADTPFNFSGWRNRPPMNIPDGLQQPSPPPEEIVQQTETPPLASAPELPTFRSAHKRDKDVSRGRKRSKMKGPIAKARSDSRKRKLLLLDSSSGTDSESDTSSRNSEDGEVSRGRKQALPQFQLPDGDPFGQPVSSAYRESDGNQRRSASEANLYRRDSQRPFVESSRLVNYLKRNSVIKPSSRDRGRSRGDGKNMPRSHQSKKYRDDDMHAQSSFEDDSTAPNSPALYGLPSIAINLDPPSSRSPSPTKKSKTSLLQSLKEKSWHTDHHKIDINDFAKRFSHSHSRGASRDAGRDHDSSNQTSRGTSPFTRDTSPFNNLGRMAVAQEELHLNNFEHRVSTVSSQNTRPLSFHVPEQPSRIRGMFKGGRIAELVGNEVSRMGDFIWKRDIPSDYRHQKSGSEASFHVFDPSDTDEDVRDGRLRLKPSRDARLSTSTLASSGDRGSTDTTRSHDKPLLHNPNLPSFTSPFQRDRERLDKKQELLTPDAVHGAEDHISRQAAQHRSRSKSPRMDRLVLPKLDTHAPQSVGVDRRKDSYGFGDALNRSQSASRAFNEAINQRRSGQGSGKSSITGLPFQAGPSVDATFRNTRPKGVYKSDLARVEALLLVSAVKAKNITASFEQIPVKPSQILLDTIKSSKATFGMSQARKRDEHVLVAQHLIIRLDDQSTKLNALLQTFSNTAVVQLQNELQSIEDQIENTITPRVRAAADNAGELGVTLTTKSTQAVKGVQDAVGEAFRLRRRGPFRWLRLLGYTVMEWIVVGLLWLIWAIVTFVRVFIGVFKFSGSAIRWLLWID